MRPGEQQMQESRTQRNWLHLAEGLTQRGRQGDAKRRAASRGGSETRRDCAAGRGRGREKRARARTKKERERERKSKGE